MYHIFSCNAARAVGVNAAIILENLRFWCEKNRVNGVHIHDGRAWTYNSVAAFSELFPYMSAGQIRGALKKLEDNGLIITGEFNKSAYDRTKWYAVTEKALLLLGDSTSDDDDTDLQKFTTRSSQTTNSYNEYTDINTGINTGSESARDSVKTRKKPEKHRYGIYENVLLTDTDLSKLKTEFPGDWQARIDRLSEYMESTGKTYKNHLATARAWARKDEAPPKAPAQPGFIQHEPGAYDRVETDPRYMPGGIFEGSWC